jgi:hypothetical protein
VTTRTDPARDEAVATYRARRDVLMAEAREDERSHRPLTAAHKRHAARLMSLYVLSEEIDARPTGLSR